MGAKKLFSTVKTLVKMMKSSLKNLVNSHVSGVHPLQFDSRDVLGLLLAKQRRSPRQSRSGRHHCAHYDYAHG